jgi:hypothetical protein
VATNKDSNDKLNDLAGDALSVEETDSKLVSPMASNPAIKSLENSEFERKLLRKIDVWLVGFYPLDFIFRVIDSANYSNAAIINLEAGTGTKKQSGFTPSQWAWTLSIVSYSSLIFDP